ncbi:MAG: GreA/GreB family elongation factor, partial [Algoriphagus sp.]
DNNYYESEWSIIKRHSKKDQEPVVERVELIPISLFDNRVVLNSTVKIKFLSNEKELKVKLVDSPTYGAEIIDGVQIVNIMTPLANSIKGRTIGDRVTIGDTNSEVQIIEIR